MPRDQKLDVRSKRAYDAPAPDDGQRVLVDRLWPRGVSREAARLDGWEKDVAPSNELRRWFHHDVSRWQEFRARYLAELALPPAHAALERLAERAAKGRLTLIYGARDREHNEAQILIDLLQGGAHEEEKP
jgi:uncharacterized protein YeaO (DUF488 family)